jgi:hypothetical protein
VGYFGARALGAHCRIRLHGISMRALKMLWIALTLNWATGSHFDGSRRGSLQDPGYELCRTHLPLTSVNKGKREGMPSLHQGAACKTSSSAPCWRARAPRGEYSPRREGPVALLKAHVGTLLAPRRPGPVPTFFLCQGVTCKCPPLIASEAA